MLEYGHEGIEMGFASLNYELKFSHYFHSAFTCVLVSQYVPIPTQNAMLRSAGARRLRKTLRRCPAGSKNSPKKYLLDLGRDTRTSNQSRRLVRRKDASWNLNWPSGENLRAHNA